MTTNKDSDLETAVRDLRQRFKRLHTGRLYMEIHKLAGRVIEVRIHEDRDMEWDFERLMKERPSRAGG